MARIVPDIVHNQLICVVPPSMTVRDACHTMAERHIGAVLVMEGRTLVGIMTERDIAFRVVARGVNPDTTQVSEVMTANPDTLKPDDHPEYALDLMCQRNYRHLPVKAEDGSVVGMVSVRDLYDFVRLTLSTEVKARDSYIFGESYGAAAHT